MNEKDLIVRGSAVAGVRKGLSVCLTVASMTGIAAGLSSCGGGDGVDIGSGQSADPVVVDVPLAYIRRPLPLDDNDMLIEPDVTQLRVAEGGAHLIVKDRASPSAEETIVTEVFGDTADIRDLSASFDGTKFLFSVRMPVLPGVDEEDLPPWDIWQYDLETETLARVIQLDNDAEAGQDRYARYLPDGRIVFTSNRQTQTGEILVDEGRGQFAALEEGRNEEAFVLHVMNGDGTDIHQISFNQSHDFYPNVMFTGEIVFSRWDQAVNNDELNIYTVNPDGTNMQLLYGANSHNTGTNGDLVDFVRPSQQENGNVLSQLMPRIGTAGGGQLVTIDVANYVENVQPLAPYRGTLTGPAQVPVSDDTVTTDPMGSSGGRYGYSVPMWDGTGRILVSYAPCVMIVDNSPTGCTDAGIADPLIEVLPPAYGIWVFDPSENTQAVVVPPESGFWFTEVAAAQTRTPPLIRFDQVGATSPYPALAADNWGLINIRSVYDVDGVDVATPSIEELADPFFTDADERPARFVRFVKATSIPDDDVLDFDQNAFGVRQNRGMREILGYAMVEPDGSVRARVPANVPIAVQVLDVNGRMLPGRDHFNWIQVMPGTETGCNGCHAGGSGESHGRDEAFYSAYAGAVSDQFPSTVDTWTAIIGETMAEARSRDNCALSECDEIDATPDIEYTDIWTDPLVRAPDTAFDYSYADLQTPAPVTGACGVEWTANCRIVINYEEHIHPLWSLLRPDVDGGGQPVDRQCISCHTTSVNAGVAVDAPAFLDLTDGQSDLNNAHFKAYRELLSQDFELIDNGGGGLVDRLEDSGLTDINGDPIFIDFPVGPSLIPGASWASSFFGQFDTGGSHEGWLTPAELKLIAEWVDVGAQYYNSPFDAPEN